MVVVAEVRRNLQEVLQVRLRNLKEVHRNPRQALAVVQEAHTRGFGTCALEWGFRWAYGPGQKCLQHRRRGCYPCNSRQEFRRKVQHQRKALRGQVAALAATAPFQKSDAQPERNTLTRPPYNSQQLLAVLSILGGHAAARRQDLGSLGAQWRLALEPLDYLVGGDRGTERGCRVVAATSSVGRCPPSRAGVGSTAPAHQLRPGTTTPTGQYGG